MGDEADPCECLWNQELSMRRLISLLRQGQSYCTDQECVDLPTAGHRSIQNDYLMLFGVLALALVLYLLRPRRNRIQDAAKPRADSHDRDDAPPTPPRT